jgi:outer membrane protein assembly factor BamC
MKVLRIGLCSVLLVTFAGCGAMGLGNKRIDYRAGAVQAPSLELPPDLTMPATEDRYKVPGSESDSVATYSGYQGGGGAQTAQPVAKVLPQSAAVRMVQEGNQRWLVVDQAPDAVWTVVRLFFQENGLSIKSEDKAAGLLETEWAENRAAIPQDAVRNVIGKVFDGMYSSGERDQYRVRLARTADGAKTEIHLSHKGLEEVMSADGNTSKWQPRAADPELEAVMLQKLMVRLGASESQAIQSSVAVGVPAAAQGDGKASLHEIFDGSQVLLINDTFDRSWRRVGLAIERAGMVVEDRDRARGIYFIKSSRAEKGWLDSLKFWADEPAADRRYRVNIKDGGAMCEVSVTDQDGAKDDATKQMIGAIYQHIGD